MTNLRVYAVGLPGGSVDHVVAFGRFDAMDVWRSRTGARPTDVFQEPRESVVRECHSLAMVGDPKTPVWEVLMGAKRGWL